MRTKLILTLLLLPAFAMAQVKFGYLSYTTVCKQMPQFAKAQQQLADLKGKYEQESQRSEAEFQRKFADFLQGQKDFPANILQKRQAELQSLMERGIAFRQEAQELLGHAEQDFMKDVYSQLDAAIAAVAVANGYAFVLNTDNHMTPFINPQMGDDVTDLVRVKLGILKELPAQAGETNSVVVQPVSSSAAEVPAPSAEEAASSSMEKNELSVVEASSSSTENHAPCAR